MANLSQKTKACRALALPDKFEPVVTINQILSNIGLSNLEEIISYLRSATDESAMVICALFDRLTSPLKKVIDIDYLIAAAKCKDPHEVFGLICKQYSRVQSMTAQMVAAKESPDVMRKTAEFAKKDGGFQHAKLLLQTTGVAPVPVNQRNIMIGNKIDNRQQTQINVGSHEDLVSDVASIMAQLPSSVSSNQNSAKDSGHRGSEED